MEEIRYKIMVVDDELFFREFIKNNLSDEFDILTVTSGSEALKKVKHESPDLILLDRVMADMSGEEICRILKSDEDTMTIPVIMVTALERKRIL